MKSPIAALALFLCIPKLGAEELTAQTVRSISTAPAGLTDPGVLAVELGANQTYNRDHSQDGAINAQLDLGITSWLDLRFGWTAPAWWRDRDGHGESGVSDPYIGGQLLFASQDKVGADIGLVYSHLLPRASVGKGLSAGFHQDTLLLSVSRTMGRWGLDINAGFNRTTNPDTRHKVNQPQGSVAITYAPAQGWNLTLDTYAIPKTDLGEREVGNILAASYDISDRLTVDMSVERGWTDASPRFAINAGLVYRIGKVWGK
ncbi:MAG: hypothetical protein H6Q00_2104 [Holophagaceae bacterium]|nr:hypothetical protein [Holophagaceae bacterium]